MLALLSANILLIFLRPTPGKHAGINEYYRSKFIAMVDGTAYKPFVYRTLLPSTVRLLVSISPESLIRGCNKIVNSNAFAQKIFDYLKWEKSAAWIYILACILMWLSFIAFAHFSASFIIHTCGIQNTTLWRSGLAALSLLFLPPFFMFTSFIYDPPQLFLFTAALYFLAKKNERYFLITFIFAVLNKETSLLLVPLWAAVNIGRYTFKKYLVQLAGLLMIFTVIKSTILYFFRNNPGSVVEFHLIGEHNLGVITSGWELTDMMALFVLLFLLTWQWQKKPRFLKVAFPIVFFPLAGLAFSIGFLDEWRVFYEVYPIALALVVDSMLRLKAELLHGETKQPAEFYKMLITTNTPRNKQLP
jgi:hypothetical protein